MRMQTKLSIVTVVGAAALLLTVLAVVIAPPSKTAYAQDEPSVKIQLSTVGTMTQGGQLFARYTFSNLLSLTCEKTFENQNKHHTAFTDPCYHRSEVLPSGATTIDQAAQCTSGLGGRRSFSRGNGNTKVIGYRYNRISPNCPVGEYTLKVYLLGSNHIDMEEPPAPITSQWHA